MKIDIFNTDSGKTKQFELLMKTTWDDCFEEDFHGSHISSHEDADDFKIYLAYEGQTILGGCIVGERNILNNFTDPIKTARKYELQKEGYKNLTYMIVNESHRNSGLGSKILRFVTENNSKLWLTCITDLIPFYQRNGFSLHMEKIEGEKVNLMTYEK